MFASIKKNKIRGVFENLLPWYQLHKRDLPWREDPHFYAVWVSEIMAQQTKMATLLPYYIRFMNEFPTIEDLALASIDKVRKAWEGLGYYQRANNLHATANIIYESGILPKTKKELLALPGIGPYTAGAILSIAYNQPFPAVDGNVLRIFSRLENNSANVTKQAVRNSLDTALLPHMDERSGFINQGLMELGAIICLPQTPLCSPCPIQKYCIAYKKNNMDELPNRGKGVAKKIIHKDILLIENPQGEFLMRQRKERLLEGLWEFYYIDGRQTETEITKTLASTIPIKEIHYIQHEKHIFTHLIWEMEGYHILTDENKEMNLSKEKDYTFMPLESFQKITIPSALRKFSDYIVELKT